MKPERIHPLDTLRGFAALGVTLFWHYSHFGPHRVFEGFAAEWLYRYGIMLVDFFFVLSGFVISHVYLSRVAQRRVTPRAFFVLRFSRLYPLHFATLLFVAAMQSYREGLGLRTLAYHANDFYHFVLNLLFLQQGVIKTRYSYNGPSWSLTIEEVSYLCFFLTLYFFARYFRALFAALLALGVVISLAGWNVHLFNLEISRGLVGFFSGCFAYQLHTWAKRSERSTVLAWGSALLGGSLIAYYVIAGYPRSNPTLVAHSSLIFPAIVLVVLNTPWLERVMSLRPLTYLGDISYSVYMLHFPVQLVLATLDVRFGLGFARASLSFFVLYTVCTFVISAASLHAFERPVQRWIRGRLLAERSA